MTVCLKLGMALECCVDRLIEKGKVDMERAPVQMDLHGGTDYLIPTDEGMVAVGLTMRQDNEKHVRDGEKFVEYVRRQALTHRMIPMHIEIIITEEDGDYWNKALTLALSKADEYACDYEAVDNTSSWGVWSSAFTPVRIFASRSSCRVETNHFKLRPRVASVYA